jgi:ferrous-iron efflux pump FieF
MAEAKTIEDQNARLMRRATYASVSVAGTLVVVKSAAWLLTDSIAMLSTLIDSLLDAAASLVNLMAVGQALKPADRAHRFGHGKAEPLAGLGQAALIAGSAAFLLFAAGHRLFQPRPIDNSAIGVGVMVFAIVLTLVLVRFQRYVVGKTKSVAISADSLHYVSDLLVNIGVIVALVLVTTLGWVWVDPVFGLAVAVFILYSTWKIVARALDMLMDRELPDEDRARIREIVLGHAEVRDMHDLRTRSSGRDTFIQLHLELDGDLTLNRAHQISDAVEARIRAAFPGAEIIIHQDPAGVEEERATFAG